MKRIWLAVRARWLSLRADWYEWAAAETRAIHAKAQGRYLRAKRDALERKP